MFGGDATSETWAWVLLVVALVAGVLAWLYVPSPLKDRMTDLWGYNYSPDNTSGAHLGGWSFYQLQRGPNCPVGSTNEGMKEGMCGCLSKAKTAKAEGLTAYSTAEPTPYISEGQVVCPSGGIDQSIFVNPAY